ncbi:putative O-succinylbenzoate-CoA ligase [Bacteriovorax sp. BSW11_IV]|uniref:class I adenylate-forming enzyme family protein n=1 Tax=Bacteriovorax sp. BSW11_IV TaxID=1353529 RepID=UPI00038A2366|nr:AMP-binding protein [Bacteriovorax sp. BSW11_IV]EQC49393.1 putative O-succinylbenzoate-CoA ligase [Bacteriovorax sp. BSW11_IV]
MAWIDFIEQNAKRFNEKLALSDAVTGRDLSYQELNNIVNLYAQSFYKQGVRTGDRVAFLATNRLEHILYLLACAKIGAIFVPLNFRLSVGELEVILNKVEAKIFIANMFVSELSRFNPIHLDEFSIEDEVLENFDTLPNEISDENPVLMLFTSGSTGEPKGALFSSRMIYTNQVETTSAWEITESDSTVVETPFFHTGGINVLLLPLLLVGGHAYLAPKFEVDSAFDYFEKKHITIYFGVPTMFQLLLEHPRFKTCDFSSLRFFLSGGAACPVSVITAFSECGVGIKQGFGLTEVGPNCFDLPEEFGISKKGSIGRPMKHSDVLVMNESGVVTTAHTPGELLIRGPHVFSGYFKDENKYHDSLFEGYFKTGDLVQFDEEGFFYVVGRIKDMYISGGENVYPGEVEKQILTHPFVREAVVVSKKDERWGEVGVAFVRANSPVSKDEMRNFLSDKLSRYKHPHEVVCLEEFPLLANGKINRQELKKLACTNMA